MSLSNTYGTGNPGAQIGNREDLAAGISMLDPHKTPVYSMLSKPPIKAMEFSWLVDDLAAPSTTPTPEGAPVTSIDDTFANQARLYNNVHKLRKTFGVTKEQQAVDSAAPVDIDKAILKRTKEIKRDIEATIKGTQDKATQGGSVAAWRTRGFSNWIDSAGPSDVPSDYRTRASSIHASGTFTETIFEGIIASIFDETGEVTNMSLIANSSLRKVVNGFFRQEGTTTALSYQVQEDATDRTVTLAVDIFASNFGKVSIMNGNPVCFPTNVSGLMINPAYAEVGNLIPLGYHMLPEDGTGDKGYMDIVFGTKCLNPRAHGKIGTL